MFEKVLKKIKFLDKNIKCKSCGAEIKMNDNTCPYCGRRNDIPTYLLIGAIAVVSIVIIIITVIIASVVSSVKKTNAKKVSYNWPTSGVATSLPKPELEYGKIITDTSDDFSIELYFAEQKDYDNYVEACKKEGFTVDYTSTSSQFDAKDSNGNKLNVSYYSEKNDPKLKIHIESAKLIAEREVQQAQSKAEQEAKKQADAEAKALKEAQDAQKASENAKKAEDAVNKISDSIGKMGDNKSSNKTDFRKWVDDYEKFMNEYVDFMNSYNPSDYKQLAKYTKLMTEYTKWLNDTQNLNESDYSTEDWQYLLDAETRVAQKLATVSVQ